MAKKVILFFVLQIGFSISTFANCDFKILLTKVPLNTDVEKNNLCFDEYFQQREIGFKSLGTNHLGQMYFFQDLKAIQFYDLFIFESESKTNSQTFGVDGRIQLIKLLYSQFLGSLKNEFGLCKLTLSENDKVLTLDDFVVSERQESEQPGTRLMLTKDNSQTNWSLECPNSEGEIIVEKKGNYIFIFMDIYENINSNSELKGHLAKFLFSLN